MPINELVWLLIPLAAFAGWQLARRRSSRPGSCSDSLFGSEYIKGLNYLLNEEQDKAIDVFIRMLEVNSDTVETHLALGNLFRKRGEVDRAIRIHQNLIAREGVSEEQRSDAVLELGQDYMKAGLFDRAEGLFAELLDNSTHLSSVLPALLDIYQQERDWENAIRIAEQMGYVGEQPARAVIAQFCCELADNALAGNDREQADAWLARAEEYNPQCARIRLIRADMAMAQQDCASALAFYEQVAARDIELLPEILDNMMACHGKLGTQQDMQLFLQRVVSLYPGIAPVLALAEVRSAAEGERAAADFIAAELARRPSVRGLSRFIDYSLADSSGTVHDNLVILRNITDQLMENRPVYKCGNCGFDAKTLHWQCPGCKHWNTIKPIHGVQGD